mgnify:CR=1 FL=1
MSDRPHSTRSGVRWRRSQKRGALGRLERGPTVKALLQRITEALPGHATLLAVCPNSKAVTRAALHAAKEADAPLLLAATLNQVDRGGGYTGWTPAGLVRFVAREAERVGVPGLVLPCLDHGGPWLKDEHAAAPYSYEQAIEIGRAHV